MFVLKNIWFSLDQTEGADYTNEVSIPEWNKVQALSGLGITEQRFELLDGNTQGYAIPNKKHLSVSPVALMPWKTLFHEVAHHLLGHTATGDETGVMSDGPTTPKCIKEAEAEATAYLCCATLGLTGMEESRGYIQHWLNGEEFPEKSARRVFAAADKILKAGNSSSKEEGDAHA